MMKIKMKIILLVSMLLACVVDVVGEEWRNEEWTDDDDDNDRTTKAKDTRIVNGVNASMDRYPYMVSMKGIGGHFCGGSLIAPDMVLSAAHCKGMVTLVWVNLHSQSNSSSSTAERFRVRREYPHKLWQSSSKFSEDVMVLKLGGQSSHPYIQLNTDPQVPAAQSNLTVTGWGTDNEWAFGQSPDILQETQETYTPNAQCINITTTEAAIETLVGHNRTNSTTTNNNFTLLDTYEGLITDDMLCAIGHETGSCFGDSGGPLITQNSQGQDIQVGVVSWGFQCASSEYIFCLSYSLSQSLPIPSRIAFFFSRQYTIPLFI